MESKLIGLLAAPGSRDATLVVRRGDGQFSLARIDGRMASAARLAARYVAAGFALASGVGGAEVFAPKR